MSNPWKEDHFLPGSHPAPHCDGRGQGQLLHTAGAKSSCHLQLPSARGRAQRGSNSPIPGLLDHTGLLCGCRASASIPCSHEQGFPRRLGEKRMRMPAARPHRAAQMQHSHHQPWDAEAQCRDTCHVLTATWDSHMAQRACTGNTQPQQNPHTLLHTTG